MGDAEQSARAAEHGDAAVAARLPSAGAGGEGAGADAPHTARRTTLDPMAREGRAETVRLLVPTVTMPLWGALLTAWGLGVLACLLTVRRRSNRR
ncbi:MULTISPECIES: hypothetical protein [unclassified Streptomyces]|uniref:hypothetical protein n=1 Tax=unclassified Streptomyces TaxID=2593676 RepID=UPI0007ECABEF|nr:MULTISPECIES: hypothetical protein [unclassified Streptomyces]MCP3768790.1 hypothetical protein [Streptomyces sp. MAR25Y5]OBQ48669.1 hypothetical protein A4U61_26785 [Streptomyces sp. H-KF8]